MQKQRSSLVLRTFFALVTLTLCSSAFAKSKIDGDWEGTLDHGKLPVVFHIKVSGGTTVDSPKQNVHGLWAVVTLEGKTVRISMPSAGAEFNGTLNKSQITGVFAQTGSNWPLTLTKSSKKHGGS